MRIRPEAISNKGNLSFEEIVKNVKADFNLEDLGGSVNRIRELRVRIRTEKIERGQNGFKLKIYCRESHKNGYICEQYNDGGVYCEFDESLCRYSNGHNRITYRNLDANVIYNILFHWWKAILESVRQAIQTLSDQK